MCDNNGYWKLTIKGAVVIAAGLFAIFSPRLISLFALPAGSPVKIYHILWALTILILVKRMVPALNKKMTSGKIYGKNFSAADVDEEKVRHGFAKIKKTADSGAARSALYWLLLLADMWLWRHVGILPDVWIYVIVIFFIFMDQFCITVFCPFKWLIKNKCCNACRINNWGYLMAFSPLVFIPTFWTYSIVALSIINVVQWEVLYFLHPERFSDIYNANLRCRNCKVRCKREQAKID